MKTYPQVYMEESSDGQIVKGIMKLLYESASCVCEKMA